MIKVTFDYHVRIGDDLKSVHARRVTLSAACLEVKYTCKTLNLTGTHPKSFSPGRYRGGLTSPADLPDWETLDDKWTATGCDFGSWFYLRRARKRSLPWHKKAYDTLMNLIDSRYRLSMVTGRWAAQLKQGTPSTLTNKAIGRDDNAVSVATKELEQGSGVRWDDALPSAEEISSQVQRDRRDAAKEPRRYSILQDGLGSCEGDNAF